MTVAEANLLRSEGEYHFTSSAAHEGGEVVQLPDGRAGVKIGSNANTSGDLVACYTHGIVDVSKNTAVKFVPGQRVFWDVSASQADVSANGDFLLGTAVEDASASASKVKVELNRDPNLGLAISLLQDTWTENATLGLGVTDIGAQARKLSFDAVAEVAMAALLSDASVAADGNWILEVDVAIFDIGDAAALDMNVGMANATHASDADSITESVFLHFDGSALDIKAESDDGTTEVAATDTTVDAVDDTYFTLVIDARDPADIQIYLDGVLVLSGSTFKLDAATGPMKFLAHIEKTSDDTTADLRVKNVRVWKSDV